MFRQGSGESGITRSSRRYYGRTNQAAVLSASRSNQMRTLPHSLQLGSGLVLFTYLFLHLFNHALGIWSVELADQGLKLAMRLWQSVPGTILLYGSAGLH